MDSSYRALTQANLWILLLAGGWLWLVYTPIQVAFKLFAVGTGGLVVALLSQVPGDAAYRRLANGYSLLLAAALGAAAISNLDCPFLLLCAVATPAAALIAARAPGAPRLAASALAIVAAAFGLAEAIYPRLSAGDEVTTQIVDRGSGRRLGSTKLAVADPTRGFSGRPDSLAHVVRRRAGAPIFEARYSLDSRGRREWPEATPGTPNVIFLGDSFAFGEGVDDGDTAPAQLARFVPDLRPVNLAFIGYGPHQALATLEAGLETDVVPVGAPAAGVYYAAFDLSRAAGRAPWDSTGPFYELKGDGGLVHRGAFSSDRGKRLMALLNRSFLLREIVRNRLNGESDLQQFVAIVDQVRRHFVDRHSGPFVAVLEGNPDDAMFVRALERLRARGVAVHGFHEIAPAQAFRGAAFLGDGHPNAQGHLLVARFLSANFVPDRAPSQPF